MVGPGWRDLVRGTVGDRRAVVTDEGRCHVF